MSQPTRSDDYWKEHPDKFSEYYRQASAQGNFVSRFLHRRSELLASLIDCKPEDVVLDTGCGSGIHMKILAPRCRQVIGVDYSPKMITRAEKELQDARITNFTLHLADAERLPLEDQSVDWVVAAGLLDYVPSPARVVAECTRVLKDPGRMVLTIPKSPSLFAFLRTGPGNLVKKYAFDLPPIDQVFSREQLDELLASTGLQLTRLTSVWTTMWVVSAVKAGQDRAAKAKP